MDHSLFKKIHVYIAVIIRYLNCLYFSKTETYFNSHYNTSLMCSFILPSSSGILQMGNGENVFISRQPPVIGSVMGNGRRRSISCPSCNGLADGNKLLAPVALACGSDGSLYVGDFNYVRRIFTTGNVTSVLELR